MQLAHDVSARAPAGGHRRHAAHLFLQRGDQRGQRLEGMHDARTHRRAHDVLGPRFGRADLVLGERQHLAERERAVERRVSHRAEIRVDAIALHGVVGDDREVDLLAFGHGRECIRDGSSQARGSAPDSRPRSAPGGQRAGVSTPHHPDHHALQLHLVGRHVDRRHRRVRRLQAHLAVLAVELLQRHVVPAEQRDHHLAVVGRLAVFDDDEVAVADLLVDHGAAAHAQDIGFAAADHLFRHRDRFRAGHRLDRRAGRDVAEQRQLDRPPAHPRRDELDRTAAVPRALDDALLLQVREVLVHGRQRRQVEAPADLLQARRVAVLLDEVVQVIQNLALAFGEWDHARILCKEKAKVNCRAVWAAG